MLKPDRELDLEINKFNEKHNESEVKLPQENETVLPVKKEETKSEKATVNTKEEKKVMAKNETKQDFIEENKWEELKKKRQHHYEGVKPIMMCADIKEPLNLVLLYFLTIFLVWYFLAEKFIQSSIIPLIKIVEDRSKIRPIRIFAWAILIAITLIVVFAIIFLFTKWLI